MAESIGIESLDFLYTPSRDVAGDVADHTDVLGGRLAFAIEEIQCLQIVHKQDGIAALFGAARHREIRRKSLRTPAPPSATPAWPT